ATWLSDRPYSLGGFGYSTGAVGYVANTITGICASAQSLYQRERYSASAGGFYYQFDCPEGIYETTLLEAETYWSTVGQRVFNVFIQGRQVLTNLDILARAGGKNLPLTLVFTNAVTNAQLQVLFTPVVDNARISGLQVRKIGDVFSDADGIPDWWRLAYFGHALGQVGDNSRAADDADGDAVSNLTEFFSGTDPLSISSRPTAPVFSITQVAVAGTDVEVTCSTLTNWNYQLQRADALGGTSAWTNIGALMSGTPTGLTLTDPAGAAGTAKFYRVQAR
ncbi:MAG: hypothetical protein EPO07_18905, partial [Verrucomicrobia bacterium]